MFKAPIALFLLGLLSTASQSALSQDLTAPGSDEDYLIKYAIYSSAWNVSSNAGLRIVAQNQSEHNVVLQSVLFQDEDDPSIQRRLPLNMEVPAGKWAEKEIDYLNLLFGSECISRTMAEEWKLVEISNYTLNPSVRGLIIEDSDSFRIYQCVRTVHVSWLDTETNEQNDHNEWVMYHFERQYTN